MTDLHPDKLAELCARLNEAADGMDELARSVFANAEKVGIDTKRITGGRAVRAEDATTIRKAANTIKALQARLDAQETENARLFSAYQIAHEQATENGSRLDRVTEALTEIFDLPGEINPSNYDHDDACELNRQFCYALTLAKQALNGERM